MAWITKNSATEKIERRDEPWLSAELRERYTNDILPRYATKQAALLPVLHELQHTYGWLPYQCLLEVAAFLELKPADVLDTVSFYEDFYTQPVGKCVIGVCQSIACEALDHQKIIDHIRRRLGIEVGETTEDGLFTLRTMECLGACDGAPCALFHERRHDNLTIEGVDALIDDIRAHGGSSENTGFAHQHQH